MFNSLSKHSLSKHPLAKKKAPRHPMLPAFNEFESPPMQDTVSYIPYLRQSSQDLESEKKVETIQPASSKPPPPQEPIQENSLSKEEELREIERTYSLGDDEYLMPTTRYLVSQLITPYPEAPIQHAQPITSDESDAPIPISPPSLPSELESSCDLSESQRSLNKLQLQHISAEASTSKSGLDLHKPVLHSKFQQPTSQLPTTPQESTEVPPSQPSQPPLAPSQPSPSPSPSMPASQPDQPTSVPTAQSASQLPHPEQQQQYFPPPMPSALQQQFPTIPPMFASKPMIVVMGQQVQTYYAVVNQSELQFPNAVPCQPIQICHYQPPLPQTIIVSQKESIPSTSLWACFINPANCFSCIKGK